MTVVSAAELAATVREHFFGDFDYEPVGIHAHAALDALVSRCEEMERAHWRPTSEMETSYLAAERRVAELESQLANVSAYCSQREWAESTEVIRLAAHQAAGEEATR